MKLKIVLIVGLMASLFFQRAEMVLAQNKVRSEQIIALFGGAILGAAVGGVAVGFFEYASAYARKCNGSLPEQQFIQRYYRDGWKTHVRVALGPALGAAAGVAISGWLLKLDGNIGLSLLAGFAGTSLGLVMGCVHSKVEILSTTLPITLAAALAVFSYNARIIKDVFTDQANAVVMPSMSFTLWSLRF